MPLEFSFGQVEAVLASLNRIADDKRVAFVGRLKQLQKQKLFDAADRPGRGRRGTYSFGDLMRFVVAVELIQSGIMPQMAARLVSGSWDVLRFNIYVCSFAPQDTIGFDRQPTEYLWMIHPEALRGLTREGETEWDHWERIEAVPLHEAPTTLARGVDAEATRFGEGWRTLVLNGYNLTQRVMRVVAFNFKYATREAMREDIHEELKAFNDDIRSFSDELAAMQTPRTPEEMKEIGRRLKKAMDADWSTNPPTPRPVLVERANEILPFLSPVIKEFLAGPPPEGVQLDEDAKEILHELLEIDVITIEEMQEGEEGGRLGIAVTPFGRVLISQIGGAWADALEEESSKPRHDPMAEAAEEVVKSLPAEVRDKIAADANVFEEPLHSELLRLGLIKVEPAPFPYDRMMNWTDLGRAVRASLRGPRPSISIDREAGNGDRF